MQLSDSWLKVKIGDADEVDINSITPNLKFIELDTKPVFTNTYQNIVGVNGSIYTASQFDKTTVNIKLLVRFSSWKDLELAKHDIYRFFMTREQIRVRCNTSPNKVYYCRSMSFDIAPTKIGSAAAVFTIPLDNPSGVAYSLLNSDEFNNLDKGNNWSYGMNIPDDEDMEYHFVNKNSFAIYNPSDISINPYLQNEKLSIQIKFKGNNISIRNQTNGSNWSYNQASTMDDTILINGVSSSLNGSPCSKNTNYGHIELDVGKNEFVISGATSSDIVFSFPFVYLS